MSDQAHQNNTETEISPSSIPIIPGSYQQLVAQEEEEQRRRGSDHDDDENIIILPSNHAGRLAARRTFANFVLMSILFSANHGCVVACLALATSRLGSTGAWQSGILYLTYTLSAILGATWIVKKIGSRNSIWLGMGFYCVYVGCFWIATRFEQNDNDDDSSNGKQRLAAYTGAAIGGIGAGFLWTSQGAYFAQAAEEHAAHLQQSVSISTSFLAGVFAFFYLAEEVFLRMLSTVLVGILSWESIFGLYTVVTLVSTMAMPLVYSYPRVDDDDDGITSRTSSPPSTTVFYKVTAAGQLLWKDPKMKWMIGLNAVFGFTSAFLNSYVNGQVVPVALNDPDSRYIGALSSWVSAVAAGMSLVFGRIAASSSLSTSTSSSSSSSSSFGSKGSILILGAVCFLGVVFPFLIEPNAEKYGWSLLIMVYTLHGVGRATFEGTLKATFADYFSYEKEGAFANIILQNGLSGAIGYVLTFSLLCETPSRYCITYSNGSLHDVLKFQLLVVMSAILAIVGYIRASTLFRVEQQQQQQQQEQRREHPTSNTHNEYYRDDVPDDEDEDDFDDEN